MKIGYARVSTREQNLDIQVQALNDAGCTLFFSEKVSGRIGDRLELSKCLEHLRPGDTLVVYKLDRLGRSLKNIVMLLDQLKDKEVGFISIRDDISTEGAMGQLMTNIIAAFAQFETDIIVERCQEGRKAAKAKGTKFGRPSGYNRENIKKVEQCAMLYNSGVSVSSIKNLLHIGNETIYRYLRKSGIDPNRKRIGEK